MPPVAGALKRRVNVQIDPGKLPPEQNIFVCIGAGGVHNQVWPHPYFDAMERGESAVNFVFDTTPLHDPVTHTEIEGPSMERGNSRAVLMETYFPFQAESDDMRRFNRQQHRQDQPFSTQGEVEQFKTRWKEFLSASLAAGKKVFLGYHIDRSFGAGPDLKAVYNELKEQYPEQLFMFMGHEGYSAIPLGTITDEDVRRAALTQDSRSSEQMVAARATEDALSTKFKFFNYNDTRNPKDTTVGFSNPEITIENLQRWTREANRKTVFSSFKDQFIKAKEVARETALHEALHDYVSEGGEKRLEEGLLEQLHQQMQELGISSGDDLQHLDEDSPGFAQLKETILEYRQMVKAQLQEINGEAPAIIDRDSDPDYGTFSNEEVKNILQQAMEYEVAEQRRGPFASL